ncbi:MAG: winged helix-turn-helix transcriptional regulator [Chloroflexi bacterium]|nr:winged helix-turn-helix transcriptional regulator [Chloroflexota bacterium]
MDTQALAREISQMQADLCSAFVEPTRILILYALNEKPRNVTDLMNELQIPQSSTSRHLKVLRDHGLVTTIRQGTSIQYQLADQRLIEALDILRSVLRDRIAYRASVIDKTSP